ncbi:MAG: hypothetical protein JXB33_00790 [Clostridia bacterium]|nr:hypothetical protein [Clostridia bacterium]
MTKKIIIIITLAVLLVLGGTLAFAAVDEDGQLVNPFERILSAKIEDGTITQDEANTFVKVWESMRDGMEGAAPGLFGARGGMIRDGRLIDRPLIDRAVMEEIKDAVHEKAGELIDGLVSEGVIDEEEADDALRFGRALILLARDADEEDVAAIEAAVAELRDYFKGLIEEKVTDGFLTREQADAILARQAERAEFLKGCINEGGYIGRLPMRGRPGGGGFEPDDSD